MISAQNNFTAIRYSLASIVALSHLAQLSQVEAFGFFDDWLNAPLAVHGFFVISGFLIYSSYLRNPDWKKYLNKRFRRILPAYIAVVVICTIGLVFVSDELAQAYFLNLQWWKYLGANLLALNFLQPELPGVFQDNPFISAVNGSLWTIKIEIGFYLTLPILVYFLMKLKSEQRIYLLVGLLLLSAIYAEAFYWAYLKTENEMYLFLHRQLPGKLCYFISGMMLYQYLDFFLQHKHTVFLLSLILSVASLVLEVEWLTVFSLTGVLIWLALATPPVFSFLDKHDYSYGIYLWHFPLAQLFACQYWFEGNPWLAFGLWLIILVGISACSWYFLEKRFIRK
jgi:peptidoglycan/LPS O-acetylase OafA/YrhL